MKFLPHSWVEKIAEKYARHERLRFWERPILRNHLWGANRCQSCWKIVNNDEEDFHPEEVKNNENHHQTAPDFSARDFEEINVEM